MVGLFLKLSQMLPGKSRRRAEILSLIITLVAFACALIALYLVRTEVKSLAPLFIAVALVLSFWMGTIYGTVKTYLRR